jgi:hypothetical protein
LYEVCDGTQVRSGQRCWESNMQLVGSKKKKRKKKIFMTCMKLYVINKDIDKNGDIERRWVMG